MGHKRLPIRAHPCYGEDAEPTGGVVLCEAGGIVTLYLTPNATATLRKWLSRGAPKSPRSRRGGTRVGHTRWWYYPRWASTPADDVEASARSRLEAGDFHIEVGPQERASGAIYIDITMGAERLARLIGRALSEGRRESRRGSRQPG